MTCHQLTSVAETVGAPRRGQQQGLNTPPSGRERCYSSLPSKQASEVQLRPYSPPTSEGFRVPPIPATPGRTQPTPSASRSVGAELTGVTISILDISCSNRSTGQYPDGHLSKMVKHFRPKTKGVARFAPGCPRQQEGGSAGWDPL